MCQTGDFLLVNECQSVAYFSGPARTANSVHVIVIRIGQRKIYYVRNIHDIYPAGSNVSRNQNIHIVVLEALKSPLALTL